MKKTVEQLSHFSCEKCTKWWTIGDAPLGKGEWFCPWCGKKYTQAKKKMLKLSAQAEKLKPGTYEHFKGGRYEVIGVAFHSETLEEMVIYREGYGKRLFCVRPLKMFLEKVAKDGKLVPRFKYIGKENKN